MASSQRNIHRSSDVRLPLPKKRKTATLPSFLNDEPANSNVLPEIRIHRYKQAQPTTNRRDGSLGEEPVFRLPETPSRNVAGPSRPQKTATPVRVAGTMSQDQGRGELPSVMGSAPRMLATPARPQARTVQEQVSRLSPLALSLLPSKALPKLRQRQPTVMRAMSVRSTPMISRSVSTAPQKVMASFPAVALDLPDSEDSSDEDYKISKPTILPLGLRPPPLGHRAARKSNVQAGRKTTTRQTTQFSQNNRVPLVDSDILDDSNDKDSEDDLYVDADPADLLQRAYRLRDRPSDTEPEAETPEDLEKKLNDMLNALTFREVRLQARGRLPFLRRNLRKSMNALQPSQWRGHDPNVVQSTGIKKVNVMYVMADYESPGGSFCGAWFCPLCAIEMRFDKRGSLDTHMYQYHDCAYEWMDDEDDSLLLRITLPQVPESDTESEGDDAYSSSEEEGSPSDDQTAFSVFNQSFPEDEKPFLRGSSVIRAQTIFTSSPIKVQPASPQLSPVRPGKEPVPAEVRRPPRPIDPADPERYPTPPPLDDLEGPSAVYPYISEDMYSARPGGPKLYDLLNELSLEPFGLMTWYIIDREEDIFELDDMGDEDKVMLALWGRWIFLNRVKFIENYEKGIRAFIDEYWRMIHRAAGFSALRTWLLVLVQNRFLTGAQFCDALKYYIDLVGMNHWK